MLKNGAVQGVANTVASTPLKNAPDAPLRASPPAASRPSAERDFKHAEQIQCHEHDERGETDDKNRAAELHAPAGMMSGGFDPDDYSGQGGKRHQHAERIDETELADVARVTPGFADETEDFQRDDRQHARHDV